MRIIERILRNRPYERWRLRYRHETSTLARATKPPVVGLEASVRRLWGGVLAGLAACGAPGQSRVDAVSSQPVSAPVDQEQLAQTLEARIASAVRMWNDSCANPNAHGMCLTFEEDARRVGPCGPALLGSVVPRPRDVASAAAAQAELSDALSLVGCESSYVCRREVLRVRPADPEARRSFLRVVGSGRLARVDAHLEAYLAAPQPIGTQAVAERFEAFAELHAEIVSLKEYPDAELRQGAALRAAWTALHFHDEVLDGLGPHASCDETAAEAKRVSENAAAYCVDQAAKSGSTSAASQACRDLLAYLRP